METALPSELTPDYTASHPIFKIWILIAAYFHPTIFLPEMTKTEIRQQAWSLCETRFEPGTFQMRIANYTSRATEQRQQTEMKEGRSKAERYEYEGQNGIHRQRRHRWVSLWMLMYLLWLLLYSANRKCASCNHYPSISEWAKYRRGQDLRNICARSFEQRHFLYVKRASPRLVCGTVIMFTASISSSDTQRPAMTTRGGSLWWAGQAAR